MCINQSPPDMGTDVRMISRVISPVLKTIQPYAFHAGFPIVFIASDSRICKSGESLTGTYGRDCHLSRSKTEFGMGTHRDRIVMRLLNKNGALLACYTP